MTTYTMTKPWTVNAGVTDTMIVTVCALAFVLVLITASVLTQQPAAMVDAAGQWLVGP